jgi:hypothetical protein
MMNDNKSDALDVDTVGQAKRGKSIMLENPVGIDMILKSRNGSVIIDFKTGSYLLKPGIYKAIINTVVIDDLTSLSDSYLYPKLMPKEKAKMAKQNWCSLHKGFGRPR